MFLVQFGHQLQIVVENKFIRASPLKPLYHLLDVLDGEVHLRHGLEDVLQLVGLYTALIVDAVEGKVLPALILDILWHRAICLLFELFRHHFRRLVDGISIRLLCHFYLVLN